MRSLSCPALPALPAWELQTDAVLPLSLVLLGEGWRKRYTAQLGYAWWVGRGLCWGLGGSPHGWSWVLTTAAHRKCGGPGGAAEGIPQQTAGADKPQACAQVRGAGPSDNQPASWGLTNWVSSLTCYLYPFSTCLGLLSLSLGCPGDCSYPFPLQAATGLPQHATHLPSSPPPPHRARPSFTLWLLLLPL